MSTPSYWVAVTQPGNIILSSSTTTINFTGLAGNTSYVSTIFGIFSDKASTGPTASTSIITLPAAPVSTSTSSITSTGATINFTATNGTAYPLVYNLYGGGSTASTSSPFAVTSLTENTSYTLGVYATANSTNSTITYATSFTTLPPAPTIGTATVSGFTGASVTFTSNVGGNALSITTFTATSSPGGFTGYNSVSPITVSGLARGTPYTFTVTATTSAGTGPASAASTSVTIAAPYTVVSGTKAPVGTAGMTERRVGGPFDDESIGVVTPFSVKMYGVSTTTLAIGSNFYIGYGTSLSNAYRSLSLTTPFPAGQPYLHLGSGDRQYTKVYSISGTNYIRVRLEGGPVGDAGTPAIYEITFFKQVNASDDIYIEFVTEPTSYTVSTGVWGMTNGVSGATISTAFGGFTALDANRSYVIILDSNGGFKSITAGQYVTNYS